ncbi:MAG: hypothetical protein HYZ48_03775, partial [Chlamydiales bacterium]|nr:hypothetical protein [Chlamydiales bacterium]
MRWLRVVFFFFICQIGMDGYAEIPHIYCEKKWREVKWEGLKIQVFKLRAEAFPFGKTYTLFIRNSNGSQMEVFDYIANKKGHLILHIEEELKKGAPFAVTPLRKGERVSYCMTSSDRQEEIVTSIIPFPIEVIQKGVEISLELTDPQAEEFLCRGKGFSAYEKIDRICRSGKAKQAH